MRFAKSSALARLAINSSDEFVLHLKSLTNFGKICTGFELLSDAKMVISCFSGLVQEPPRITPWWKSCNSDSEGSRERKEMPSFFEIVSNESMKGTEGDTASLIFVRTKLEASRSFLVWK